MINKTASKIGNELLILVIVRKCNLLLIKKLLGRDDEEVKISILCFKTETATLRGAIFPKKKIPMTVYGFVKLLSFDLMKS